MDIISYALCKKYSNMVALGLASATVDDVNKSITFTLATDGSQHTIHFNQPSDGQDGVSVIGISDKGNGKFTLLFSDGSESDPIQCVKGEKGDPGVSPTITENADNTDKIYKLDITTADSTFTTPNLKGADGQGGTGGSGEENTIDSISVNGVNVMPDENKNVDIKVPSIEGLTKDADLATVAKSGNYEDLSNKPSIPDITGLATETYVDNKIADYTKTADLADVAKSGNYEDLSNKPSIPDITGLATETYVDNKIADYTKTADLADVAKSGNYEDLSNKPAIPTVTDEYNAESSEAASGKAINQAMSTLKGLPKPYFVFVDDDGKENFKTLYTDILQPRGIVGGLSIVFSSYTIDANKYLTQNEINEYSNLGWDVLCHSTDLNSLTIDTADAVLNYCDNRIAYYGFKKSNIFVYPNGNEGDNKIAIEEKVAKHFKYAFNINYSHNCPASIPLQNRMDIGRIVIPKASEITAEIKAYYKNLVDETINGNKLMIISTHSDKSDYTYLTELLDYILNQGYSFTSPVKALSEIDEYRFQNKLIPGDNISITPDNIISASFTDYDDTEVKESIDELSSNLDTLEFGEVAGGKNLFNKETAHIGKVILFSSGEMITNADYFCTDYIPVIPNTTYVRSAFTTLGENWYYDIDKNPLNSIQENENIFTTPENAYYVRLSGGIPNVDIAQLEEGSVATEYEPYIPSNKMLAEEKADKSETTVNLLKPALQTTTSNDVTCTNNGDGTYTLNGTAISTVYFRIKGITYLAKNTTNKYYKLVGCPTGGTNKYDLRYEINGSVANGGGKDFGDGVIIKNDKINSTDITSAEIIIAVLKDVTVNNLVFKPMLTTNLNATYDDFVPYTGDSGNLNGDVAQIKNDLNNYALKSLYGDTTINVGRLANSAVGNYSTAEGHNTTASGDYSHAEGEMTTASALYTHSEGVNTSAVGQGSHAEGSNLDQNISNEIVFEDPRRVEIYDEVTGNFINITVAGSQAFGLNSHAEGCSTLAYGKNSHTEGYHSVAQAKESHAEGSGSEANGTFSHAEGVLTKAKGIASHAEGYTTTANGNVSHAEGYTTTASGTYSHAEGYRTTASNLASHVSGKYNAAMTTGGASGNTTGTAFVIGNGTGTSALSNAFSVHFDGTVKAKSTITASTTADYAEFFEWLDKNPNKEDRVGHFVTLDGDKIKIATSEDDYILGIVSGEPFVLGNGDCDTWNGMYLHDEFRRTMYEPAPKIIEILDNEGNPTGEYKEVEGEYEGTRPVLNPDYDKTKQYISRFDRAEWSPVGMLGVLAVLHDGTAEVNGYVTVNNQGIATKCTRDTRNSYRVIKKVSDKVVEVIFK